MEVSMGMRTVTHVNREEMAVPEEVKEFNKQVCSDYPGVVYVFVCSLLFIFPILSILVGDFQIGRTFWVIPFDCDFTVGRTSMH